MRAYDIFPSVAERSFSLYDRVEMFVKPMPQPLLHSGGQLQNKTHQTQGLKNFKVPPGIRNDMGAAATQLVKRQCLSRFVGKSAAGPRVSKHMVQAIAQHDRQHLEHDLTVTR